MSRWDGIGAGQDASSSRRRSSLASRSDAFNAGISSAAAVRRPTALPPASHRKHPPPVRPDQDLHQTEEVHYKLDGLVLVIEGIGRRKSDSQPVIQALGIISFDDETATYYMRAFNNGRFLETEVKLLDQDKAIGWGFALGEIKTNSVLRVNDRGEWTELAEITIGSQPPKKLLELTVRPVINDTPQRASQGLEAK